MKLTHMELTEGAEIPSWYGIAYYSMYNDTQILYPVPLNLIVRMTRWCYWKYFYIFKRADWCSDPILHAYNRGYFKGREEREEHLYRLGKDLAKMLKT